MGHPIELGLDTFGDVSSQPDGTPTPMPQVLRDLVEQAALADRVGVDFFNVGEHHRDDFAVTAPEVLLAAIASRTQRLRLGTAVTVLSSDDAVRVYERFATLDALSQGRAELTVGRGSFIESFPLFGFDLKDYERLFEEKLDLLAALLTEQPVTWQGSIRPPLKAQAVYPKTAGGRIRAWVGVGGTPESVVRAAHYGLPLVMAIIGGAAARFAPLADLYRRALLDQGRPLQPIAIHSPGFVADSDEAAVEALWPHHRALVTRIGRERGWPPPSRASFEAEVKQGALHVGSPETVAQKMAASMKALGATRFQLKYTSGPVPHEALLRCIELYGTQVLPRVRELLA